MGKIFKESVWDFLLGKVVSVLGILGTAQTLISLFKPDYVITVAGVDIDYRVWFILTLILVIGVILRILHVASHYKHLLEAKDRIVIVYNEKNRLECRQEQDNDEEVIRLGIKVIGKTAVENVEVFPKHLYHKSGIKNKRIRINRLALEPMMPDMLSRPVNPGVTPTCFVDLLKHKLGTCKVSFCYRGFPDDYMRLSTGTYELEIEARGGGNQHGYKTLLLSFGAKNVLTVETVKGGDL